MANRISVSHLFLAGSLLALAVPSSANADDNEAVAAKSASSDYVGLTSGGSNQNADHIDGSGYGQFTPSFQLGSKDEKISADFSLDYTFASQPKVDGDTLTGNFLTFSLKGSVPLNGTGDQSSVDFKSFGDGGSLTFGFNFFHAKVTSAQALHPAIISSARACVLGAIQDWSSETSQGNAVGSAGEAALNRFDEAARVSSLGVDAVMRKAVTVTDADGKTVALAEGSVEAAIAKRCTKDGNPALNAGNDKTYITLFGGDAVGAGNVGSWRRTHRKSHGTVFLGGEVSLGYNRFSIADRPSLSLMNTSRVGFDGNIRAGVLFPGASTILLGNLGFARTYTAKAVVDVCGPPDVSGKAICINGQDGLPDRKDTGYAGVTLRQVVLRDKGGQPMIGIRPSATYIFEDKDWQFELPVYFQRNKAGGLDAGVRAIYNTGKDKFSVGAFVGTSF